VSNFGNLFPIKMDTFETIGTCRCCLNASEQTFHMSEVMFEGNINASQSYFDLTGLTEDLVPDSSLVLCSSCRKLLETSFAFRKTCLESHNILMTRIKEGT
jgi:Zinc-finger associated domain (zf-AD)